MGPRYERLLRIRDITGLRLDKAEPAFLSACQTHLAPRAHSDEPVRLAGALQLAASGIIAARWQLNSLRSRHVTTSFYEKLLESSDGRGRGPRADSPQHGTRPVRSGAGAAQRTPRSRAGVGGVRAPRPVAKRQGGCLARPRHCCEQPPLALVP
ncbi:CHAT domain-containing protein [Streptomyces sp. LN325]|uniref:CHAT domain-containing protein n=1 Tax=Streptomyces sp. LN325 TaxID=3112976 RepID=UPI003714DA93